MAALDGIGHIHCNDSFVDTVVLARYRIHIPLEDRPDILLAVHIANHPALALPFLAFLATSAFDTAAALEQ